MMHDQHHTSPRARKLLTAAVVIVGVLAMLGIVLNLGGTDAPDQSAAENPASASATGTPEDEVQLPPIHAELENPNWVQLVTEATSDDQQIVVTTTPIPDAEESPMNGVIAAHVCEATERAYGTGRTVVVRAEGGEDLASNDLGKCKYF